MAEKRRAVVKSSQLLVRATHCRLYVILTMTQAEGRLRNATRRHTSKADETMLRH